MTNIKLKNCNRVRTYLTVGKVYPVTRIDEDGDYWIYDDDGDEYFVESDEVGSGKAWEKLTEFGKHDLLNGDIVITRNGIKYAFMQNVAGRGDAFVCIKEEGKEGLNRYADDLLHLNNHAWDIMEVHRCSYVSSWSNWDTLNDYECVFKREDRKRMTVEEIEEQLGYKIEVIDNE